MLSQNYLYLFLKHNVIIMSSKLPKKLKNVIKILVCPAILFQTVPIIVLINNPRPAYPTKNLMSFLSFSDNLLQDA